MFSSQFATDSMDYMFSNIGNLLKIVMLIMYFTGEWAAIPEIQARIFFC